MDHQQITDLVKIVKSSPKYHAICPDIVYRIVRDNFGRYKKNQQIVQATKRKLHQICGAFDAGANYQKFYRTLQESLSGSSKMSFKNACRTVMSSHASTRERLPLLDDFYSQIFRYTGEPETILDLANGLNALSIPWMNLSRQTQYRAYDIDERLVTFTNQYLELIHREPLAFAQDIIEHLPAIRADVVFFLKSFTTFERQVAGFTRRLIETIDCRFLVVSFPVKSLGGKQKGMAENYEALFFDAVEGLDLHIEKISFSAELVYIIAKSAYK
ncbi:hypothetical protein JXJ21_02975 [candidate division KSB1 bacterium]|nr:hypothetical protein [candidate division KSB1 bacterium]